MAKGAAILAAASPTKRKRSEAATDWVDDNASPPKATKKTKIAYTTAQKAAITQFTSLTQADKSSAAKVLKQYHWDVQTAANSYFSGGANMAGNPHKAPLNKLFDEYRENAEHNPDEVNMEGMMKLMGDMDISVENVGLLVFSELVQSPTLGTLTREGFVDGLSSQSATSLPKIRNIVLQRQGLLPQASFRPTFKSIYKHTFVIARAQGQKSVALEAAIEYWRLLLVSPSLEWSTPNTPWLDWWIDFLEKRWSKSVNKDMWDQTLSFAIKTLEDESLGWWSEDSAWPGVIDEFVEYVQKEKRGSDAMEVE